MKKWKITERDGLDILTYEFNDGKIFYRLSHQSSWPKYDSWDIEIENDSPKIENGFIVNMSIKVKHGPRYDNRVLKLASDRIKKLLKELKP